MAPREQTWGHLLQKSTATKSLPTSKLAYKKGSWFKMLESVRPANQTLTVFPIRTMCNLITTNSRRLGVVSSIT